MAITLQDLERAGFRLGRNGEVHRRASRPAKATNDQELALSAIRQGRRRRRQGNRDILESRFLALWSLLGGPVLEREYRFAPPRRWRTDFCHMPSRTFIEIEGGIYGRGHHVTAQGYTSDAEKYNAATMSGFSVFRLTSKMIRSEVVVPIINFCQAHCPLTGPATVPPMAKSIRR